MNEIGDGMKDREYTADELPRILKEGGWCDHCDDRCAVKVKRWESSIAVIVDYECSICGEIFYRMVIPKRRQVMV